MSRVGRTQSGDMNDSGNGSDGKLLGLDKNTALIVAIIVIAGILIFLYFRNKKTTTPADPRHHIVNNGCKSDAECPTGKHCKTSNGLCVDCTGNSQCDGLTPLCDTASNKCVECNQTSDCQEGQECIGHVCSPPLL